MKFTAKPILIAVISVLSAVSVVFYGSCNKDTGNGISYSSKCKNITCANKGVCNDGVCTCPSGYEGTNCEIISRNKFTGMWSIEETGTISGHRQYPVVISTDDSITTLKIGNFYNYFKANLRAIILKDTITIPNQALEGKVVFGKGYVYSDSLAGANTRISLRYEVIDTLSGKVDDFGYYGDLDQSSSSSWHR